MPKKKQTYKQILAEILKPKESTTKTSKSVAVIGGGVPEKHLPASVLLYLLMYSIETDCTECTKFCTRLPIHIVYDYTDALKCIQRNFTSMQDTIGMWTQSIKGSRTRPKRKTRHFIQLRNMDGNVVSAILFQIVDPYLVLDVIGTDKKHRNRGYATLLISTLRRMYPEERFHFVTYIDEKKCNSFYTKIGFRKGFQGKDNEQDFKNMKKNGSIMDSYNDPRLTPYCIM